MCIAHQRAHTNLGCASVCPGRNTPADLRNLLWRYISALIPDFRTGALAKTRFVSRGMLARAEMLSRWVDLGSSDVGIRWLEVEAEDACWHTRSRFLAGLLTSPVELEAQVSLPTRLLRCSYFPELFFRRVAMFGQLPSMGFPAASVWKQKGDSS